MGDHTTGSPSAPGYELPLRLLLGFRQLVDQLHVELARQGHPHVRPMHGFALQAVGPHGTTASELARRLAVSKQAVAKTIERLEELGYLERSTDPRDARRRLVTVTRRGQDCLSRSGRILQDLHGRWGEQLGSARLVELEAALREVTGPLHLPVDTAGWLDPS